MRHSTLDEIENPDWGRDDELVEESESSELSARCKMREVLSGLMRLDPDIRESATEVILRESCVRNSRRTRVDREGLVEAMVANIFTGNVMTFKEALGVYRGSHRFPGEMKALSGLLQQLSDILQDTPLPLCVVCTEDRVAFEIIE